MSVTAAAGFTASGVAAGIKPNGALDVALVTGPPETLGAAVFTSNRAAAAPVVVSRRAIASGPEIRGVVLNSGCANAATGAQGIAVAERMAATVAGSLGCDHDAVIVCSTGPIGTRLDQEIVAAGCVAAAESLDASGDKAASEAILTTDTRTKTTIVTGAGYTVGGMAKGAGMIRPDMATMLAVVTTDAVVEPHVLHSALGAAVDRSFNSLDVDGCESTNDTVVVLASGASGVAPEPAAFAASLTTACVDLARHIAADAEGASRVVTIEVAGALDDDVARRLGRTIADSALVRASFYGGDPNWGRILGALGTSDEPYAADQVDIVWHGVAVTNGGEGVDFDEDALADQIAAGDFTIEVSVGSGAGNATVLTTDLTPEYAVFNGERS